MGTNDGAEDSTAAATTQAATKAPAALQASVRAPSAACGWALAYAARGWHVFPVGADKRPRTDHGHTEATTAPGQIRDWWRRWPDAGIGVAAEPSRLCVVDLDDEPAAGKHGSERFRIETGDAPHGAALVARTPRGGRHLVYGDADGPTFKSNSDVLGKGCCIDVKCRGGYFIVASGNADREWIEGDPFDDAPGPMPAHVAELLREQRIDAEPKASATASVSADDWARLAAGVAEGSRNGSLAKLVGRWLGRGMGADEVRAMAHAWAAQCAPPLPTAEADSVVDSILRSDRRNHPERHAGTEIPPELEQQAKTEEPNAHDIEEKRSPLRDWRDVATDPPVRWLVHRVLPRGGLVVLGGDPGAGKTLLALDAVLRCSHGLGWLGQRTKAASTVYLAGEGSTGLAARLRAWAAAHADATPLQGNYLAVHDGMPNLGTGDAVARLAEIIESAKAEHGTIPDVLIVDTLAMATPGAEENDAGPVGAAMAALSTIRRRYGCCIIVVHHTRKPGVAEGATRKRTLHDLRGSSALAAAADVVLLASSAEGGARALSTVKIRDGEPLPAIPYRVTGHATGRVTEDGEPEYGPVVVPAAVEAEQAPQHQHEAAVAAVCEALRNLGSPASSIDQIVALAGIGNSRGRPAVRTALSRGLIQRLGSAREPLFRCVCEDTPYPGRAAGADQAPPPPEDASTTGRRPGVDRASGVDGATLDSGRTAAGKRKPKGVA